MNKSIYEMFHAKSDLRFLTVKGDKYQDINKVQKLVAKIANTYYIVRELNKKSCGYHFHALLSCEKEPTRRWFKKGVHMHLKKVGKIEKKEKKETKDDEEVHSSIVPMTSKEVAEWIERDPDNAIPVLTDKLITGCFKRHTKRKKKEQHLMRILNYMSKEFEYPAQYSDYILVVSKHNRVLPL